MTTDVDCIVIGAGVVGLAIARELAAAGRDVLVLEQHDGIGAETSSRNSEVIHAGLYYPTGSLKARLCVEGKKLLYRFAAENGVPVQRLGKLLVATSSAELPKLESIAAQAARNGVTNLVRLNAADVKAMEPALQCSAAYLSPSTGIVDSHALMIALEGHIQENGGQIVLTTCVSEIRALPQGYAITTSTPDGASATITCNALVIAAGLHSSSLAATLFGNTTPHASYGDYAQPQTYFAKGHYFTLQGRAPFTHLIYPMPGDGGLGVHLTLDLGGAAKFGPDVSWIDRIDYAFDDPNGSRKSAFEREIRHWWPDLPGSMLAQGYTGIRPKLTRAGEPAVDFAIHGPSSHGLPGLVALFGIESPGLTAALAIAREVHRHLT
ncbi:MAG: NAD(P)/FAD-dependent oxidoreductase [Hyphomicrobiaceae bacterium]|nr:NAD(P)/FAD-dependent oxidoreductase [Hyphomicrobiaceae bacterium]